MMAYAKTDPHVLGYLGRALSLELTAVQQYLTMSRLLTLRGFDKAAEHFKHEALEEMEHVERIISRMLVLGVAPNASQLRPARLGDSLPALIASAQSLEVELVGFYQQAVSHCGGSNDFDNQVFFEQLLREEREHLGALANWQQKFFGPQDQSN